MALKDNLRKALEEVGISPTELAKLSRTPYRTIQRILNDGQADPRLSTIKPIIITLGVSADQLIFDEDEQGKNGRLEILFRELTKMEGEDRRTAEAVIKALIVQSKSKELNRQE